MAWKEIARYRSGCPDGSTEEIILEKNKEGFRIKNDFGNINIELDKMSARELFKNLKNAAGDQLEQDLFDWFENDMDTDCDGDGGDDWGSD